MPSRRDLSPYVVHLTRDYQGASARENLLSILSDCTIEARSAYGVAVRHLELIGRATDAALASQRVVCFSETPPDYLYGLVNPGIWRRYAFRPYGVAFTREYALNHGANAVWYLNSYIGEIRQRWLAKDVNDLIDAVAKRGSAEEGGHAFAESTIARLTPFMEVVGQWETMKKDFTFEREWRRRGNFEFAPADVAAVIVPPGDVDAIRAELIRRWDPTHVGQLEFLELDEGHATASGSDP